MSIQSSSQFSRGSRSSVPNVSYYSSSSGYPLDAAPAPQNQPLGYSAASLYAPPTDTTNLHSSTAGSVSSVSLQQAPELPGHSPEDPSVPKVYKRPRRKHHEIDRLYTCGYEGCTKGYGTLNHLNAHVKNQGHGPKRTSEEFKEVKKRYREMKKRDKEEQARLQERHMKMGPSAGYLGMPEYTTSGVPSVPTVPGLVSPAGVGLPSMSSSHSMVNPSGGNSAYYSSATPSTSGYLNYVSYGYQNPSGAAGTTGAPATSGTSGTSVSNSDTPASEYYRQHTYSSAPSYQGLSGTSGVGTGNSVAGTSYSTGYGQSTLNQTNYNVYPYNRA